MHSRVGTTLKVYTTARVDTMSALVGTTAKVSITASGGADGGVGWSDGRGKGGGKVAGEWEGVERGVRVEERGVQREEVKEEVERGKYRWRLKIGEELGSIEEVGRGGEVIGEVGWEGNGRERWMYGCRL